MDAEMLKVCLELVMQDGLQLQYMDDEIKNNREIVKAAVLNNPYAINYASDKIYADAEIMAFVVNYHYGYFQYVSENLKSNVDFIKMILNKNNASLLKDISEDVFDKCEDLLLLVLDKNINYKYIPNKYKKSMDFIIKAVVKNPNIYRFIETEFKNNLEICCLALLSSNQRTLVYKYVSPQLQENAIVLWCKNLYYNNIVGEIPVQVIDIVQKYYNLLLMKNSDILRLILCINKDILKQIIKDTPELLINVLKNNGELLYKLASIDCCKTFVKSFVYQNPTYVKFMGREYYIDDDFMLRVIEENLYSFLEYQYVNDFLKNEDFMERAVQINGMVYTYSNFKNVRRNKTIVLLALQNCAQVYDCLIKDLKKDKDVLYVMKIMHGVII